MNSYSYQAVDATGRPMRGMVEAESVAAASKDLAGRGLYVLKVVENSNVLGRIKRKLWVQKVKRTDLIDFATNLSVMLGAGIPLLTALGDIADAMPHPTLQSVIADVRQNIERGSSLSAALELHSGIFPDIFIRLLRVGEETGRFEQSLADIAEHLQRMDDLSGSIKRAMIYPIFAIVSTLGALAFWMLFVLPKLAETLKELGVKLPLLTRILIASSDFTRKFWYLGVLIPVLIVVAIKVMKRYERSRYLLDMIKLKLPIYKLIENNRLLALFSEQMRILIITGLTIDRTLAIIADVLGNLVFRKSVLEVRDEITSGTSIAEALKKQPVFPVQMNRFVAIGETSGTLDGQFAFLANMYFKKLDDLSDKIGKIIEPLVISAIGILFLLIIGGLLLPVYDLVSNIGKG